MNIQPKHSQPLILSGRDVTAVLGPTNTGKTHLAIERMVAHETGIIGLPLRLLAREVYARVCEKVGAHKVALITGEEKIVPAGAKYSVCTVEAMPRETDAAFVAIDEVQLAGDLERGHIFTDRILHLRGRQETLLLGAATMHGILQKLLKGVSVVTRPRLSHLAYSGSKKLTRLPRRTAIVAFSADEVYAIAELIRRQQGGAAVVLGALSPRTRNAQVEIFQSGDVDYLVATDAIGMGLNLDLEHVAFAQNRKFDGYQYRNLTAAELGQIAGRAGRHLRDGTFGVTGQVDPFDEDLVAKIEAHDFDPVKVLQWRTADFDFSSLDQLKRSIETNAPVEGLTRALPAVDAQALEHLSKDGDIRALATGKERVALLWEACALPDYRKIAPAQHADLIASIYMDLARHGHVDENYMAEQVRRADTTEGDIDTLSHRIAQIRTWTFVSNRPGWLADQLHWQEKTREIEDRLSDALHERLTKRFVDRRTSVLMRRLRENTMPEAEISPTGTVLVEGHHVGELQGFRFTADQSAGGEDAKAVRTAAQKALAAEFDVRAERFAACANGDVALGSDGVLRWIGAPIGTLVAGDEALKPRLVLLADEQLTGPARDKVAARAERFVNFQIESLLKPLVDLKNADQLTGIARGIAFQLVEHFGLINRRDIAEEMKTLDQEGRAALRRLGVRFGAYHVFVPALIKPAPAGLVTLLWALKNDGKDKPGFGDVVHALASGRTSVVIDPAFDKTFYKLAGYRNLGRRAVRIDILERLADLIRPATNWKPGLGQRPDGAYDGHAFMVTPPMMSILGATADDMEEILKGLGYRAEPKPAAEVKAKLEAQNNAAREAAAAKLAAQEAARAAQAAAAEVATTDTVADTSAEGSEPAAVEPAAETPAEAVAEVAAEPVAGEQDVSVGVAEEAPAVEETAAVDIAAATDAAVSADAFTSPSMGEVAARSDAGGGDGADDAGSADTTDAGAPPAPALRADPPHEGEGKASETPAEAEEPKPILLWRQARFDHQRPRHRHDNRRDNRPRGGQPARGADATSGQPGDKPAHEGRRDGAGKPRFDRSKYKPRPETGREGGERREGRPQGERPDRHEGGRREGRPDWKGNRQDAKGNAPGGKPAFQSKPREKRPQRFDPDSPFAKLAALRDQLKK
ncbi:helicase [Mesorhizobium sp. M2D.F.Ca.ET.185.01.1.1]|uniref:helicase-related protein n=1 Tax=unclassified Mesorhizobium TaxID=325217 RepID=UPI000FCCDF34|nr:MULTISPECIES: helicase-related protein [unclassified Mesorhizobium]TGP99651.1 helicase [bacterium M00.F.Ca.ET.221.01.1.1]TGQ00381.1 helicase [bacterium M00.F.Ca.ET.222.01.1.1]TGU11674.1 helicase [bacterium M00.F.Ca.ET.163.01.1.1]TGV71519.1 helicase [Mesorhizobium sp. M2D.F.Ca.ET.160.01.1.1]RVD61076.1 helicase [Mesorhizobium sp. M2D.F.Ca.ET.140.01.1.1]